MKTKIILSFLIGILTMAQTLSAQQASINGKVTDVVNNTPIEYGSITLLEQDSTYISGVNSDENGTFNMGNVIVGNYLIRATCIGYTSL